MATLTTTSVQSLTNQELGDLLMESAALFYSLEVVEDLTPLIGTLREASKRLDRLQQHRQTVALRVVKTQSNGRRH